MNTFTIIRLGKSSIDQIQRVNMIQAVQPEELTIQIRCKQVPSEVVEGVYCFLWLGSDNNKGMPTPWKQGLKAVGNIVSIIGGPSYMDESSIKIQLKIVFRRSLNKTEILRAAGLDYINISNIPVIGLNTSSNQTVQIIKDSEEGQDIAMLLSSIVNAQPEINDAFAKQYPELAKMIDNIPAQLQIANNPEKSNIESTDESNVAISIPFDPNLIRLRRDPYTLGELIDRIEHDEINFLTGFQRKAGLWDLTQQSRLIESILLKLPLPAFYFDETEDNRWQVIDCLQRTTSIKNFIVEKSLELQKLEFLTEYNEKRYDELPRDLHRRIKTTPLMVYVVEKGTPDEVKFNIFKRINTGGLVLTPQEIRHALNQGIPAKFIEELASLEEFKHATGHVISSDRMEDRDFVTRFVSFYRIPFFEYTPDLDSFMTKGMASLKNTTSDYRADLKLRFIQAMNLAVIIFGNDAFRKRQFEEDRRKPINKALFETLAVWFSKLDSVEVELLRLNAHVLRNNFITLNHDFKFINSISSGTGQFESVIERFHAVKQIVDDSIKGIKND